jgi:hypothetical protein
MQGRVQADLLDQNKRREDDAGRHGRNAPLEHVPSGTPFQEEKTEKGGSKSMTKKFEVEYLGEGNFLAPNQNGTFIKTDSAGLGETLVRLAGEPAKKKRGKGGGRKRNAAAAAAAPAGGGEQ